MEKRKQNRDTYTHYRPGNRHSSNSTFIDKGKIINTVITHFGISMEQLISSDRKREICYCRHSLIFFLVYYTNMSLKTIGEMFGARDHTTVIHAREKIEDLMDSDPKIFDEIKYITEKIHDMHIKVDSDEELVKIATEAIHILNNLLEANKNWNDQSGYEARQNKTRWEQLAESYLARISGNEVNYKSTTVKIVLTHETGILTEV